MQSFSIKNIEEDPQAPLGIFFTKHFIRDGVYGCRIVAKFNTHNLYSIRTFYIQYTHFIFNTLLEYSINPFYIQYLPKCIQYLRKNIQ